MLTYEQAKTALRAGGTIVGSGSRPGVGPERLRRGGWPVGEMSMDGGERWIRVDHERTMETCDGAYVLDEPAPAALDSRAEIRKLRDLVELRTLERDEARDDAAHFKQAYESASAQATRFAERLGEQARCREAIEQVTAERDEARDAAERALDWANTEPMKYVAARGDLSRALAARAGLTKHSAAKPRVDARPPTSAEQLEDLIDRRIPDVGADVPGSVAWDHMMACPQARYRASYRRIAHDVLGGTWNKTRGLLPVSEPGILFLSRCACAGWTFTRLPDAPVSP